VIRTAPPPDLTRWVVRLFFAHEDARWLREVHRIRRGSGSMRLATNRAVRVVRIRLADMLRKIGNRRLR
jgi:hypothetical protein